MGIWGNDSWRLEKSANSENINVVLGAYRSILHPIAYMSLPITSGKKYYEVLEKHGVKTTEELDKELLYLEIIKPNIEEGLILAERLSEESILPVVAPSIFEAKKQRWGQNDYMFLWFRVIEEKARRMYMKDGWEYSNGGSEEFVRAMEMQFGFINPWNGMEHFPKDTDLEKIYEELKKIKVYDERGNELRINDGFSMIKNAIIDLDKRGFKSQVLNSSLDKLYCISGYFTEVFTSRRERNDRPYEFDENRIHTQFKDVEHLVRTSSL